MRPLGANAKNRVVSGPDFSAWLNTANTQCEVLVHDRRGPVHVTTAMMTAPNFADPARPTFDLFVTIVEGGCYDGVQVHSLNRRTAFARHDQWLMAANVAQAFTVLRVPFDDHMAFASPAFAQWAEDHLRGRVQDLGKLESSTFLGFSHADDIAVFMLSQWHRPC